MELMSKNNNNNAAIAFEILHSDRLLGDRNASDLARGRCHYSQSVHSFAGLLPVSRLGRISHCPAWVSPPPVHRLVDLFLENGTSQVRWSNWRSRPGATERRRRGNHVCNYKFM